MPNRQAALLIVDDDPLLPTTLPTILAGLGYRVRSVEDGFSALAELRNGIPDVILSDLNMPGMSGFELLSVIRRRFPAVQAIALSGAHAGDQVPAGVAAEAFYEKGSLGALLRVVERLTRLKPSTPDDHHCVPAPIWVPRSGYDPSGKPYAVLTCVECLRPFAQVLVEAAALTVQKTDCVYCHTLIHYAIVKSAESASPKVVQLSLPMTAPADPASATEIPGSTQCQSHPN